MELGQNLTPNLIRRLSYFDFIGLINQWNTPPGSYSTISKLALFSGLSENSKLLDVGCSTGFSSREFALRTDCRGLGFDRSKGSIAMAKYNKKKYTPNIKISYRVADGMLFKSPTKFSHIMLGGNLAFFPDPRRVLENCLNLIQDGGHLLCTPYYEIKKAPTSLNQRLHKTINLPSSAFGGFSYKEVMELYNKFEIIYEEKNSLTLETEREIEYYCHSVVHRACSIHGCAEKDIYEALYNRLFEIRRVINESRKYQKYLVLVLRYRRSVYPKRFVALF